MLLMTRQMREGRCDVMLMNAAELSSHMLARRASGSVPQKRDSEIIRLNL